MAQETHQESQVTTKSIAGVTRQATSNRGDSFYTQTFNSGTYFAAGQLKTQEFITNDKETVIKGNDIQDIKGSASKIVSGTNETVCGSQYQIIGTADMYHMSYQELANRAQAKMVAARSQQEEIPDTSLIGQVSQIFKPAPGILNMVVQPKAEDLKDKMDSDIDLPLGASIIVEIANYIKKVKTVISCCTLDTAKEVAKYQANYMKEAAKESFKEKQKMVKKMPVASQESFRENLGHILFPDGDFSASNALSLLQQLSSDPTKIISLFYSPSTQNLPKEKNFDDKQYQKLAADAMDDTINAEKMC